MQRQGPRLPGRLLLFGLLFGLLRLAYDTLGDGALPTWVIQDFTVPAAAALLGVLDPQLGVMAQGARLQASGGGLQVLAGCEGSDAALLLSSAMLVVPARWQQRLIGVLGGLLAMALLNQARVLALFYAWRHDRGWFDALHGTLLPLLMVAAAAACFVAWTAWLKPPPEQPGRPAAN